MRILIVEDERGLANQLARAANAAGYAADMVFDGEQADLLVTSEPYDVIVLDLGLPKIDGLALLRRWRQAGVATPVLVLTARSTWHEKVQGIDGGADDYVSKPFQIEEVFARIRGLIRRASGNAQSQLSSGALTLDTRSAQVFLNGAQVRVTSHEFRVLAYLMHHRNRVVSKNELTEHIYAQDFDRDSNTIEVFVARLRRKFGPAAIETVRGLGYRIGAPSGQGEA